MGSDDPGESSFWDKGRAKFLPAGGLRYVARSLRTFRKECGFTPDCAGGPKRHARRNDCIQYFCYGKMVGTPCITKTARSRSGLALVSLILPPSDQQGKPSARAERTPDSIAVAVARAFAAGVAVLILLLYNSPPAATNFYHHTFSI